MIRVLVLAAALTLCVAPETSSAQAATWAIDPVHSELTFRIRHYVTKVRGTFGQWSGTITADPKNLAGGAVDVSIESKSIDTNNETRDNHLRSPDFFAADSFPKLTFKSTRIEVSGSDLKVYGNLTIRGTSKPVVLVGSVGGVTTDAEGKQRIGFEAGTKVDRMDYRVAWNRALEGGGLMLGDEVEISITIEAVKQ